MSITKEPEGVSCSALLTDRELIHRLRSHFQSLADVNRGVCLLSAGQFDQAAIAFSRASIHGSTDKSLASYMAACHVGKGDPRSAADLLVRSIDDESADITTYIRCALAAWSAQSRDEAISTLREAISIYPESAELHFQLGILLTDLEEYEEAELRFTQAVSIDKGHSEALVSLAMCCGVRKAPEEALSHLKRAQARRPRDAKIGLLLAQAATAVRQKGHAVSVRATLPGDEASDDPEGIEELTRVIEADPDFVDSFLSIPPGQVDLRVFAVLLKTIETALENQPEQAEFHFHCGQVLSRLGRQEEAIDANERAVGINPRSTRALIALGRLYQQTDRDADATKRLEEAVKAGAEYADVFYMLGNLYRNDGRITDSRKAYRRALTINDKYQDAREALAALPA